MQFLDVLYFRYLTRENNRSFGNRQAALFLMAEGQLPQRHPAECALSSPGRPCSVSWHSGQGTGSCLLLCSVTWLGQNPRWLANWTRDTAVGSRETSSYSRNDIEQFQWLTLHSLFTLWLFSFFMCFCLCVCVAGWSLFTGPQHPNQWFSSQGETFP